MAIPNGRKRIQLRKRHSKAADNKTIHCTNSDASASCSQSKPSAAGWANTHTSTISSASTTRVNTATDEQRSGRKKSSPGWGLLTNDQNPFFIHAVSASQAPSRKYRNAILCTFPYYCSGTIRHMSQDQTTNQSWGGRFSEPVDAFVARFTASVDFDKRLYKHDIQGSIAHATMLAKVGVLSDAERDSIIDGLRAIQSEIEAGQFDWRVDLEDVHMNIEARLTERIGITGKKLHTGRSRNDQVATDIRLWLREEIDIIVAELERLQRGLLDQAEQHADVIMPGFTHLQTAQPVTFGHHLLAWFEMLCRDR